MRNINLDILQNGLPGISKAMGSLLAEAAAFCLDKNCHTSGVKLALVGDHDEIFEIEWSNKIDSIIEGTWQDLKEATEFGATGIALLIINQISGYHFFERSKGESFDYYLIKNTNDPNIGHEINNVALLEISGIWHENKGNTLNMRINFKKKQIEKIPHDIPIFIVVVEFGFPKSKMIKK